MECRTALNSVWNFWLCSLHLPSMEPQAHTIMPGLHSARVPFMPGNHSSRVVSPTPPQIFNRQPRDERVKERGLGTLEQTAWRTGKEYDVKSQ